MKKYILVFLLFIPGKILISQDNGDSYLTRPLDGLYLNLLGDASIISINFEKLFPINRNLFVTSKLGFGYSSELFNWGPSPSENFITIPFHLSSIIGKNKSFLELGLGSTLSFGNTNEFILYPIFGYRLQPLKAQKFSLRIVAQWPFKIEDDPYFFPIGISLGISF